MRLDAMVFFFWMLNFKSAFSLYSFTFIKRLFNSSLLSAIRMVSSAYLRLLIFLPAILIPVCASSSLTFCMMYSAYKLNNQDNNIQLWCTPFPSYNTWNKILRLDQSYTHTHTHTHTHTCIIRRMHDAVVYNISLCGRIRSGDLCHMMTIFHSNYHCSSMRWRAGGGQVDRTSNKCDI